MSFVIKLGVRERPQPRYTSGGGGRWEYVCGWCGEPFMFAAQLVAHVALERKAAAC